MIFVELNVGHCTLLTLLVVEQKVVGAIFASFLSVENKTSRLEGSVAEQFKRYTISACILYLVFTIVVEILPS